MRRAPERFSDENRWEIYSSFGHSCDSRTRSYRYRSYRHRSYRYRSYRYRSYCYRSYRFRSYRHRSYRYRSYDLIFAFSLQYFHSCPCSYLISSLAWGRFRVDLLAFGFTGFGNSECSVVHVFE